MFRRKNTSKNAGGKGRNNRTTKNNRNNRSGSIPNSRPNNNRSGSIPSSRPKNNFSKIPRPRNTLTPYRTEYARNQPTIYSNLPSDPSQALNVLNLRNTPNPAGYKNKFNINYNEQRRRTNAMEARQAAESRIKNNVSVNKLLNGYRSKENNRPSQQFSKINSVRFPLLKVPTNEHQRRTKLTNSKFTQKEINNLNKAERNYQEYAKAMNGQI
jgi:hypothetical protein